MQDVPQADLCQLHQPSPWVEPQRAWRWNKHGVCVNPYRIQIEKYGCYFEVSLAYSTGAGWCCGYDIGIHVASTEGTLGFSGPCQPREGVIYRDPALCLQDALDTAEIYFREQCPRPADARKFRDHLHSKPVQYLFELHLDNIRHIIHPPAHNQDTMQPKSTAPEISAPASPSQISNLKSEIPIAAPDPSLDVEVLLPPAKGTHGLKVQVKPALEKIEAAIEQMLVECEVCRQKSAVADLRAGVLFHIYRQSLIEAQKSSVAQCNSRKCAWPNFWSQCETRFQVNRSTISRKMRLAVIWAKQQGADEETIRQLAEAADLTDTKNRAIQLCLNFIGDQTTTDLYREHKLISYGPVGGDNTPRNAAGKRIARPKRTNEQIAEDDFRLKATCWLNRIAPLLDEALLHVYCEQSLHYWDIADQPLLERLNGATLDLHRAVSASVSRRAKLASKI